MNRLFSNAFWLMASQIGGLLIPLIELPLLARRLGADEYGKVVYVLAISIMASVFIEYGFNFSAVKKSQEGKMINIFHKFQQMFFLLR